MFTKILEFITGKDDLERVAWREDLGRLNAYLRTRRVSILRRPRRFLDAASFTENDLIQQIQKDLEDLAGENFEPWILEIECKKRLPVFSSQKKIKAFATKISRDLNKVFGLASADFLLEEITRDLDIDYVDLNLFSQKSWEIAISKG